MEVTPELKKRVIEAVKDEEILQIVKDLVATPSHWAQPERERPIAEHLRKLFASEGIDCYLQEVLDGRPNVIATLHGAGGGKSLMFNGHIDTVPTFGMKDPFNPVVENGKMHGRGSADMKSGIGTMAYALIILKRLGVKLKGDLIYAGVIDEDAASSKGTRHLITDGPLTDYAVVGEPTKLFPVTAHKGCDYWEIEFTGKSNHSSVPENGINAISAAVEFVKKVENELIPRYDKLHHPLLGRPTVNIGLIQGSAQANRTYLLEKSPAFSAIVPDKCTVYIDVRWIPCQTEEGISRDFETLAKEVTDARPGTSARVRFFVELSRPAMDIDPEDPLVKSIQSYAEEITGEKKPVSGEPYWGDGGLLYGTAKVPTLMFGPGDIAVAHSDYEFVDVTQFTPAVITYVLTALDVCGYEE